MKTSALRRWIREERRRENAEALASGVDIAPIGGPVVGIDWAASGPLRLEGLTSIDYGTPWPPLRHGHRLIDTGPSLRLPIEDGDEDERYVRDLAKLGFSWISRASVLVFRARADVSKGEPVTPDNCEGVPGPADGLSGGDPGPIVVTWADETKAGAPGRVFVPAFGMDRLPPMPDPGDDDQDDD